MSLNKNTTDNEHTSPETLKHIKDDLRYKDSSLIAAGIESAADYKDAERIPPENKRLPIVDLALSKLHHQQYKLIVNEKNIEECVNKFMSGKTSAESELEYYMRLRLEADECNNQIKILSELLGEINTRSNPCSESKS